MTVINLQQFLDGVEKAVCRVSRYVQSVWFFFTFKGNNSNQYCQKNKHYILGVSGSFIRRYGKGLRSEFIFLS